MRLFSILLSICFLLDAKFAFADDKLDLLTKRIEELERQQEELSYQGIENSSKVNSFLKDSLTLGGFFEPAYTILSGPDTKFQATNSSNLLGLNFAAEYSDKLRFISQLLTGISFTLQNQHNDPRAVLRAQPATREFGTVNFGAILTQGYLDYTINAETKFQAGQGYVPFGYAAQQREIVLFVRRGGPQILRTTELFAPLWSGFHFFQNFNIGKNQWGYNVYSFTRFEDAKLPGIGARSWWSSDSEKIITGLSFQSAKYHGEIDQILGYDLRFKYDDFLIVTEVARHFSGGDDPWSAYIEPSYFLSKEEFQLYTFVDFSKSPFNKTAGTISDPFSKIEFGAGINWLPTSYTRLRLGITQNDYIHEKTILIGQNRDYKTIDISAGVAF